MTKQNELKSCLLCGGEAEIKNTCRINPEGWGKSYLIYWVECKKCENRAKGFNTIDYTEAQQRAINAWNEGVENVK